MEKAFRNLYGNCETGGGRPEENLRPAHRARGGVGLTFYRRKCRRGTLLCTLRLYGKKTRRYYRTESVEEAGGKVKQKWEVLPNYSKSVGCIATTVLILVTLF